jgi:hypothetical protein
MKVNVILFNQGSGGNFLSRVLTLDPKTVCLGADIIDTAEQRCEYYCYDPPTIAPNTHAKNGLSVWVDQELNKFYFPFSRGIEKLIELDKLIIEPMHPSHWDTKRQLLGIDDQIDLYYIDPNGCESWIKNQVRHKIYSPGNIEQEFQKQITALNSILQHNNAQAISLKNILDNDQSFLWECEKICNTLEVEFYSSLALKIYKSWRRTWAP